MNFGDVLSACVHAPGTRYVTKSIFAKAVFLFFTPTIHSFIRSRFSTLVTVFNALNVGLGWTDRLFLTQEQECEIHNADSLNRTLPSLAQFTQFISDYSFKSRKGRRGGVTVRAGRGGNLRQLPALPQGAGGGVELGVGVLGFSGVFCCLVAFETGS